MLENIRGHSRGSIPPLRMPSPLPHDLCHEWNVSRRLPAVEPTQWLPLGQWFLSEDTLQCLGHLCLSQLGGAGVSGVWWSQVRDAAENSAIHRTSSYSKGLLGLNMSIVPRLRSAHLSFSYAYKSRCNQCCQQYFYTLGTGIIFNPNRNPATSNLHSQIQKLKLQRNCPNSYS